MPFEIHAMKKIRFEMLLVGLIGLMMSAQLTAQDKSKRPSPPAMANGKIGNATALSTTVALR